MSSPLFSGVYTALVTPFRDGVIDESAYVALIEAQIKAGVSGLIPVGTTGETSTLSIEEHKSCVTLCIETVQKRVQVIAGAGSNNTRESIELAHHAKSVGADGVLVVAPYYNRPSQEGIFQHYKAINDAVEIPVVLYNVPSRTVSDISNETVMRCAELKNIVGIKDATGALDRLSQMRLMVTKPFSYLSGDDATWLGYMAHGGHGCISVTCNVAPEAVSAFLNACMAGDWTRALHHQDRLIRLHKALFLDASPSPTKFALAQLGRCTDEVRLPVTPCAEAARPKVLAAMSEAGVEASADQTASRAP